MQKHGYMAAVTAVLAIAFAPAAVFAATPAAASGAWDDCNFGAAVRSGGPNLTVNVGITENFSGSLSGTYAGTERDQVYADGSATFHGSGTFTGWINGRSGTGTYKYEGSAPVGTPFTATWVFIGQTGGLTATTGRGTFGGTFTGVSGDCDAGMYAGTYAGAIVAGS